MKALKNMQSIAVTMTLDWVVDDSEFFTLAQMKALLHAAIIKGDPNVVMETIIPRLISMPLAGPTAE